jgi:hypothetical protein
MSPKPYFSGVSRRVLLSAFAALPVLSISAKAQTAAPGDMLPSWNEGATKQAILNFVAAVTREGSADFVPPAERIATFDNDGTLWVEHPMYTQLAFGLDRVKALAALHPEWKNTQPFKAALEGDMKTLAESGERGMAELVMATHAGMSTEEFRKIVIDWFAAARHPRFKRPYTELSYQPMIELLGYLRANGFKTFIVSGGGIEFMRPWTERVYGVPPEQVVGSSIKTQFLMRDGKPELFRLPELNFIDDKAGKPVGINEFIGRARSRHSAIPTAISKCCNGRRSREAPASACLSIIPMRYANTPTTGTHPSVASTKPSMPQQSINGSSPT